MNISRYVTAIPVLKKPSHIRHPYKKKLIVKRAESPCPLQLIRNSAQKFTQEPLSLCEYEASFSSSSHILPPVVVRRERLQYTLFSLTCLRRRVKMLCVSRVKPFLSSSLSLSILETPSGNLIFFGLFFSPTFSPWLCDRGCLHYR